MSSKLDDIMDQRLARLNKAKQKFDKMNQISVPKIQKIPVVLRRNERFASYCSPKMISFGPIHHNVELLKQGEDYKLLWTSKFVEYSENQVTDQAIAKVLLKRIEINTISYQVEDDDDEHNIETDTVSWHTYKNIRDLKIAGIRMLPNFSCDNPYAWNNIYFTSNWFSGELRLPIFVFHNFTPYLFRNLIAYEMCPDVHYKYECCSFFSFMDSLIDTAEDVKELRISGVFQNLLGSDQDLANLFNELGNDLVTTIYCQNIFISTNVVAFSKKYILIKQQIENHCRTKWKTWLAEAYNTHFNSPWAMFAFLAALLALTLTFIQTWFTINPK